MSGLEIFGIAAAVLQIADLGAKVSVKLFGFARKVRGAAEKIEIISKEIAATGALLQQLSEQLDKDSHAQLLRQELVDSANELVLECKKIFKNIDKAIDGNSGNKIILSLKQKIHYTYLESEIEALRMNLESLKSSIGIMQNLLIYAEQLRNRERFPVLKEQQDLLKVLGEEKLANEQRYNTLMKAISERPDSRPMIPPSVSPALAAAQSTNTHVALGARSGPFDAEDLPANPKASSLTSSTNRFAPDLREMREYIFLVARMLEEIHSKQYYLDISMRERVHDGVLDLHWQEWAPFRLQYGDDALLDECNQLPELRQFWIKKIEDEGVANIDKMKSGDPPSGGHGFSYPKEMSTIQFNKYHHHHSHCRLGLARDEAELLLQQEEKEARIKETKKKSKKEERESIQGMVNVEEHSICAMEGRGSSPPRDEDFERTDMLRIPHSRPRYTKVKRKYLSEDTLNFYELPWIIDRRDPSYFLIKEYISERAMEEMFADTRHRRFDATHWRMSSTGQLADLSEKQARVQTIQRSDEKLYPPRPRRSTSEQGAWQGSGAYEEVLRRRSGVRSRSRSRERSRPRSSERDRSISRWRSTRARSSSTSIQPNIIINGGGESEPESVPTEGINIQSLLSQWTTLSPWEIARGDYPGR